MFGACFSWFWLFFFFLRKKEKRKNKETGKPLYMQASLPVEVSHLSYGQVLTLSLACYVKTRNASYCSQIVAWKEAELSKHWLIRKNDTQPTSLQSLTVFHLENTTLTQMSIQYFTFFCF